MRWSAGAAAATHASLTGLSDHSKRNRTHLDDDGMVELRNCWPNGRRGSTVIAGGEAEVVAVDAWAYLFWATRARGQLHFCTHARMERKRTYLRHLPILSGRSFLAFHLAVDSPPGQYTPLQLPPRQLWVRAEHRDSVGTNLVAVLLVVSEHYWSKSRKHWRGREDDVVAEKWRRRWRSCGRVAAVAEARRYRRRGRSRARA